MWMQLRLMARKRKYRDYDYLSFLNAFLKYSAFIFFLCAYDPMMLHRLTGEKMQVMPRITIIIIIIHIIFYYYHYYYY